MPYLNYGIAAIEAMIIAKVILIGRAMKVGTRFESRPLAMSVAYKTIMFGLVVLAFGVLERIVTGLFQHKSWSEIVHNLQEHRHLRTARAHVDDDDRVHSDVRVLGAWSCRRRRQAEAVFLGGAVEGST